MILADKKKAIAGEVLSTFTYKKGFEADFSTDNDGFWLEIAIPIIGDAKGLDETVTCIRGSLRHKYPKYKSDARFARAIKNRIAKQILDLEMHEAMEWLKFDETLFADPHVEHPNRSIMAEEPESDGAFYKFVTNFLGRFKRGH